MNGYFTNKLELNNHYQQIIKQNMYVGPATISKKQANDAWHDVSFKDNNDDKIYFQSKSGASLLTKNKEAANAPSWSFVFDKHGYLKGVYEQWYDKTTQMYIPLLK